MKNETKTWLAYSRENSFDNGIKEYPKQLRYRNRY